MTREVVISQRGHEAEVTEYLSQLSPGHAIILDMGGMLPPHIRQKHASIRAGTFFSDETLLAIDRMACDLAQDCHGGDPGLKYKGISAGDTIAYEVMHWLISAMKHSTIIARLCAEEKPKALVMVDDSSPIVEIITSIAEVYGLPARRLARTFKSSRSPAKDRSLVRRTLVGAAQTTYEYFHSGRNTLTHLASIIKPGFQRPNGLRSILFDPYIGYEWLMPALFGSSCRHIVIPCPNVRLMPRIRYYQDVFGVPTRYFHPYGSRNGADHQRNCVDLFQAMDNKLRELCPIPQIPYLQTTWTALRRAFQDYCAPLIQKACAEIDTAELIIRKHKIDATLLPWDEMGFYKALTLVGKRDGLLTIRYQHGIANRYRAFVPPSSDKVVVWDEDAWSFFRSLGVAENRLTVMPNPLVRVLESKALRADRKLLRRRLGIAETDHVVLFAAMPYVGLSALDHPEEVARILTDILDVVHRIPESRFLIKLHPNNASDEEVQRVQKLVDEHALGNVIVLMSGDTHQLILASDVLVAETSTCLWEAMVLNRPTVAFINREFIRQVFPYGPNSGIIRVDSPESLIKVLREGIGQKRTSTKFSPTPAIKIKDNSFEQSDHYNDPRWELLSLIPSKTRRLLDVGCGAGWLGQKIKATRPCFVVGIEGNADAAKVARKVLDEVFVADIEQFSIPFHNQAFDCIVFGDILEHLRDPWKVLKQYVELLGEGGVAIISIPNIGHYTTLLSLVRGHWKYKEEGILDRTHLRFFTRTGIDDLLVRTGLRVIRILCNTQAGRIMRIGNVVSGNRLVNLITFQYLAVAKRRAKESNL